MSKHIFSVNKSASESSLWMNDDKSFTYTTANDGWAMARNGSGEQSETLTADEAKARWPQHAAKIEEALRGS